MKTFQQKYFTWALFFLLCACSKDSDPGPKGEKGDQGIQGVQGVQGEQGPPGTANVRYSAWMRLDWNYRDATSVKEMAIEEPLLTEDFINKGGVLLAYLRYRNYGTTQVFQLPFSMRGEILSASMLLNPPLLPGDAVVFIKNKSVDGTAPVFGYQEDIFHVRYVLIPGGIPVQAKADLPDFSDYQAVKAYYHIVD